MTSWSAYKAINRIRPAMHQCLVMGHHEYTGGIAPRQFPKGIQHNASACGIEVRGRLVGE
jgi:hypothetical protein